MSKLAIYAGHGGSDPGACANGKRESDYTLKLMQEVTRLLRAAGHTVVNNRTTDIDSPVNVKAQQANDARVDFVMDIHLNAGGGHGSEVYHALAGGKSKEAAQAIVTRLAALGFTNRGIKTKKGLRGDYFAIIRETKAPAVLVETCFIDSDADMKLLDVCKAAQAIADGVLAVYPGEERKPTHAPAQPTKPATESRPTVKSGSTGDAVKTLQKRLTILGYPCGAADGIFGVKTKYAVQDFQRKQGIAVDGIVGTTTWARLDAAKPVTNPYKEPTGTIRKGATGEGVKWVQEALRNRGYYVGASRTDGIFGSGTDNAVRCFQREHGLSVDGIVGPATRAALRAV